MYKTIKGSNVDKLKKALDRVTSLNRAKKILAEDTPITLSVSSVFGGSATFSIGSDVRTRRELLETVERLVHEDKNFIRKKYEIDIR